MLSKEREVRGRLEMIFLRCVGGSLDFWIQLLEICVVWMNSRWSGEFRASCGSNSLSSVYDCLFQISLLYLCLVLALDPTPSLKFRDPTPGKFELIASKLCLVDSSCNVVDW